MIVGVIGAGGFIGGRLVDHLMEGPLGVRSIVRHPPSSTGGTAGRDVRIADALDEAALTRALYGCDVAVHSIAGPPATIVGSIAPLYRAATRAGLRRIVFLSSAVVHGQAPSPGTDEASPITDRQPLPYNAAKVRAEDQLRALRLSGGVEVVILRPGIVVGPGSRWITSFADDLLAGTAYLIDRGRGICNSIQVDNLIHAIELAIATRGIDGEAFLVGDEEQVTWWDLYQPVAASLGKDLNLVPDARPFPMTRWIPHLFGLPGLSRSLEAAAPLAARLRRAPRRVLRLLHTADFRTAPPSRVPRATLEMSLLYSCEYKLPIERARSRMNYLPPVSFPDGCSRSIAWLRSIGYDVDPISGPR